MVTSALPPSSSSPFSSTTTTTTSTPTKKEDGYVLARDFKSASRLNYEHYLWHETLGFHIHPTIVSSLSTCSPSLTFQSVDSTSRSSPASKQNHSFSDDENARSPLLIADLACGTALWATHVAQAYPWIKVHGYDLSLEQAPPRQWIPENLELHTWDLFDPELPSCLVAGEGEVYDVVHLRLVFVVVKHGLEDVRKIIRQAKRLLKSGGWLQWDELDVSGSYVLSTEQAETPRMEEMVKTLGGIGGWVQSIGDVMREEGMTEMEGMKGNERKELARAFFDNHLAKDEEMAFKQGALEGGEGKGDKQRALDRVKLLAEEGRKGAAIVTPKVVWVGRKGA
ncbi:MAG: hypothetical protein Q9190_000945 [Brigantiaea leucoxantha]